MPLDWCISTASIDHVDCRGAAAWLYRSASTISIDRACAAGAATRFNRCVCAISVDHVDASLTLRQEQVFLGSWADAGLGPKLMPPPLDVLGLNEAPPALPATPFSPPPVAAAAALSIAELLPRSRQLCSGGINARRFAAGA